MQWRYGSQLNRDRLASAENTFTVISVATTAAKRSRRSLLMLQHPSSQSGYVYLQIEDLAIGSESCADGLKQIALSVGNLDFDRSDRNIRNTEFAVRVGG
jgi:hypothetical protein